VLTGLSCLGSFETLVKSGIDRGYEVTIVRDAIALPCEKETEEMLTRLETIGCQIINNTSTVVRYNKRVN
jgi:hypothetical protein